MSENNDREKQKESFSYQYDNTKYDVKIEQTRKDNGAKDTYVTTNVSIVKDNKK